MFCFAAFIFGSRRMWQHLLRTLICPFFMLFCSNLLIALSNEQCVLQNPYLQAEEATAAKAVSN